uniref:Uncharacterized protein n=1 Tax=Setaria digitata TaxID=48799 RepID=A0A915PR27_9BILA
MCSKRSFVVVVPHDAGLQQYHRRRKFLRGVLERPIPCENIEGRKGKVAMLKRRQFLQLVVIVSEVMLPGSSRKNYDSKVTQAALDSYRLERPKFSDETFITGAW